MPRHPEFAAAFGRSQAVSAFVQFWMLNWTRSPGGSIRVPRHFCNNTVRMMLFLEERRPTFRARGIRKPVQHEEHGHTISAHLP
jgi:hypothetical protein